MKIGRRNLLAAILAIVGLAAASHFLILAPAKAKSKLQALAERACKCDTAGGGSGCWNEFDLAASQANRSVSETACIPISVQMSCASKGGDCFVTRYNVSGVGTLCREEDAQTVQAAYDQVLEQEGELNSKNPDLAYEKAMTALKQAFSDLRTGKKPSVRPKSKGCV